MENNCLIVKFKRVIVLLVSIGLFVVNSVNAQCPGNNEVGIEISNVPPAWDQCHVVASDLNHVMAHENYYLYLTLPDGMNATNFDLLVDGSPAPNLVASAPSNHGGTPPAWAQFNSFYRTWLTDPGIHIYELRVRTSGCPTIIKTDTIEIFQRDCPHIESSYTITRQYCFSREDALQVQLNNTDDNSPIVGATWEIFHSEFPFYTYDGVPDISHDVSAGDQYLFSWPYPGNYRANAVAEVLLPNGRTCLSKVDGPDFVCETFSVPVLFSDAYFELEGDLECGSNIRVVYKGEMMYKTSAPDAPYDPFSYSLFLNGSSVAYATDLEYNDLIYTFPSLPAGNNTIQLIGLSNKTCPDTASYTLNVPSPCTPAKEPCESCNTFRPEPGERYWVSAWVKEIHPAQVKTYESAYLQFDFTGSGAPSGQFYPSGDIIEGWQRIVGSFTIPANTSELGIKLRNGNASVSAYFDDIRIHPFNASMKSYVYDPATFWLTAELDDNNYATFYEYDKEGQLIRIKKETARGIMTIQESRSSAPKRE